MYVKWQSQIENWNKLLSFQRTNKHKWYLWDSHSTVMCY